MCVNSGAVRVVIGQAPERVCTLRAATHRVLYCCAMRTVNQRSDTRLFAADGTTREFLTKHSERSNSRKPFFITMGLNWEETMNQAISFDSGMIGGSKMDPRFGHVRGRVLDITGAGLQNSRVWIRETGRCTYTDASGNFVLINVPPAVYSLVAESEGCSQSVYADVPIEAGDNPGHVFVMIPHYVRSMGERMRSAPAFQN
jgi:hypothetical protein